MRKFILCFLLQVVVTVMGTGWIAFVAILKFNSYWCLGIGAVGMMMLTFANLCVWKEICK